MRSVFLITTLTFLFTLVTAVASEAMGRKPTVGDSFEECCSSGTNPANCDDEDVVPGICYCCYTEGADKGCWICNADEEDCVYDMGMAPPKNRKGRGIVLKHPTSMSPQQGNGGGKSGGLKYRPPLSTANQTGNLGAGKPGGAGHPSTSVSHDKVNNRMAAPASGQ